MKSSNKKKNNKKRNLQIASGSFAAVCIASHKFFSSSFDFWKEMNAEREKEITRA